MGSLSPLQIAFLIVAAVSAAGVIITFVRSRMTYSGYGEIVGDIRRLGSSLGGETFRDGADVVVSGSYQKLPAVVRFSNAENTPGLNIRVQAPATFNLSVVPSGAQVTEGGRILVRTTDEMFDARFNTRTDQPTQAKMFLTRGVTGLLQRLACSKNTFLSVGSGAIELSELVIPATPGQHAVEHLKAMVKLSEALREMPGAETVKLVTFERERNVAGRIAMVAGAIVALASIFAAVKVPNRPAVPGVNATLSSGIMPLDAIQISNAPQWRVAHADELDGTAVRWLRSNGGEPMGRIEGDFSGSGFGHDIAYLLVTKDGSRRVVLLAGNENRYDTRFPYVGLIARVPKDMVSSVKWLGGKAPQGVTGDGLLLVRDREDGASGMVLFLSGRGVVSAVPVDYPSISLR
jgi:hypothetical protein